jgi:hypothetical protein
VEQATALVHACLDEGITFFDCAEAYSDGAARRGRRCPHGLVVDVKVMLMLPCIFYIDNL